VSEVNPNVQPLNLPPLLSTWRTPAAIPQPSPTGEGRDVTAQVIEDIRARSEMGRRKYGTVLRTDNGRDALMDAYQEALDLCCYLKQAIMERNEALDGPERGR